MARLAASPYLARLAEQFGSPNAQTAQNAIDALGELKPDDDAFAEQLIELKDQFALGWAWLSATDLKSFSELGILQCQFADSSIDAALRAACFRELTAQKIKFDPAIFSDGLPGLFILGLGKLGGLDLNFSSDVDLVAFYDPEILPIPAHLGQGYVVNKILKTMSQYLKPRHGVDFVWRVDWRLRPDSSASHLAMSTAVAQDYYFFRALPWHRLALMKARVIAGDKKTGKSFQDLIAPFVWRQNLDYRALDELAHLKSRINLEHPGLKLERKAVKPISANASGFNVKLGRGGIREIEFIANAQQLLWGGKQYPLRTSNTIQALTQLAKLEHMDPDICERLQQSYIRLRRIENAIQMLENNQTHLVPKDPEQQQRLLNVLGEGDWDTLCTDIYDIRHYVSKKFGMLFGDVSEESKPDNRETIDSWVKALPANVADIAISWSEGFRHYGLTQNASAQFKDLGYAVLEFVRDGNAEADLAINNIDQFFRALSKSEQYFHLLNRKRDLLNILIPPLIYSPHMTVLLQQSPHIIDVFLSPQDADDPSFIFESQDYETRLERLRRFVNENLFKSYHEFMTGAKTSVDLQKQLTELATTTVQSAIQIAVDDLKLNQDNVPLAVIGLGKMGTNRMAPLSDIDLVFIFADDCADGVPASIVRRMRTILSAKLREGIAYELDMRLRPSGRSGPPAVFLHSFKSHHFERAWNWEHIALAHSRVILGDPDLTEQLETEIKIIKKRPRDEVQFQQDAKVMWTRITEQRRTDSGPEQIDAKLCEGGLMEAEFLDAVFKILDRDQASLAKAIEFWSNLQIWERLLDLTGKTISEIPEHYASLICRDFNIPDINALEIRMVEMADHVKSISRPFYDAISLPQDYQEGRINWTN